MPLTSSRARLSVLQAQQPYTVALPQPNATIVQQDRQLLLHFYSDILAVVGGTNLNTSSKRGSALQSFLPFKVTLPLPTGSLDLADRQHIADTYSGIAGSVATNVGTGALTVSSVTMTGAGKKGMFGSGVLLVQTPTVVGATLRHWTGSGDLTVLSASMSGAGPVSSAPGTQIGAGDPVAANSTITSVGHRGVQDVPENDALLAKTPIIVGSGVVTVGNPVFGSGIIVPQSAVVAGAGVRSQHLTGSGALTVSGATIVGASVRRVNGTGAMASKTPVLLGLAANASVTGSGALTVQTPVIAGTAARRLITAANLLGTGGYVFTGNGNLGLHGAGALTGVVPVVAGVGSQSGIHNYLGTGTLAASNATMAGAGRLKITGTGALVVRTPTVLSVRPATGNDVDGTLRRPVRHALKLPLLHPIRKLEDV